MKARAAVLTLVATLMVGCGDKPLKTGTLAGGVNQLHYSTKTESGMTDSAGAFQYREGETVTFSVGGTTIGKATGADTLTIFDLFSVTAPTEAAIILQELSDTGGGTDFRRVVDAWSFLMAIDIDGHPSNGIDLTGLDAALATVSVDFNWDPANPGDDEYRIAARIPNYALRFNGLDGVLSFLYRGAGIAVSGGAISRTTYSVLTSDITYDSNAQATQFALTFDGNAGSVDLTHDSDLRLLTRTTSIAADGVARTQTEAYAYSLIGVYSGVTTTIVVVGAAGPETSEGEKLTYDITGRLLTHVVTSFGSVQTTTFAYDDAANAVTTLTERRDSPAAPATYRSRVRVIYDDHGRSATQVYASGSQADDVYDYNSTDVSTYDKNGLLVSDVTTATDPSGNTTGIYTSRNTYDKRRLKKSESSSTTSTDVSTTTYTYDGDNLVRKTNTTIKADGSTFMGQDTTQTFDATGRLLASDYKQFDQGGALNYELLETRAYDAAGNMVTTSDTYLGSPPTTRTFEYTSSGNGAVAALQVLSNPFF